MSRHDERAQEFSCYVSECDKMIIKQIEKIRSEAPSIHMIRARSEIFR